MKDTKRLEIEEKLDVGLNLVLMKEIVASRMYQIQDASLEFGTFNDEFKELSKINSLFLNLIKIRNAQEDNKGSESYSLCNIRYYKELTEEELLNKLEEIRDDN